MRRRVVTVLVVALVSAIGALVVRQRRGVAPEAAPATERADASPPPLSTLAPAPRPTRDAAPKSVGNPSTKGSLRVRVLAAGAPAVGATVRSVGRGLEAFQRRPGETTLTTDKDGFVEIDTSAMTFLVDLEERSVLSMKPIRIARVDVTLEGWSAGRAEVDLGPEEAPGNGRLVTIDLRQVATISGRVLASDGTPIAATAQALFDEDTPAGGTRSFGDGVVASEDGRFRLSVDGEGPSLFVVARGDARPFTTPVTLVRGRVVDVGDVHLERGASLAGKIRCGGIPAGRTNVIATWYGPGFETARPAGHGLLWVIGRRAIWSQLEVRPDAEGHFRIDGLESGPYRLRVPTEDWALPLHPEAYAQVDRLLHAPDEGIEVDAERSLLQIGVTSHDDVLRRGVVTIEGGDTVHLTTGTDRYASLVVRAGSSHHVVVSAPGLGSTTLDVTGAESGATRYERVALPPAPPATASTDTIDHAEAFLVHVFGPDGVTVAAPFRVIDDHGRLTAAMAIDRRDALSIVSPDHTSWSGPTWFTRPHEGARPTTIEFGGGLFETRRIEIAPSTTTTGQTETVEVLLHAR